MLMQPETVVYAGTPICLQEEAIGLLSVFCFAPDTFSAEDGDRLAVFAEQAAIAIHNARLYQQSQELAVMQERQRLARDLHDSISQTLFTASVTAESAVRQWESNPHKAKNLVAQLHQLTSNALTDMRMLLLELRPASLAQTAFPQLLEQLCQSLQSRRQVECELAIDDLPPLPENLKVGLYRVVQEAMNNITKHSHATHVHVSARLFSDELVVQVRDNGRGFLPDQVSPGSMGLGIMRERMDLLGASLNVESQVGQGTQVTVRALL
jgi:signal transduction histidine kinase